MKLTTSFLLMIALTGCGLSGVIAANSSPLEAPEVAEIGGSTPDSDNPTVDSTVPMEIRPNVWCIFT